MSTVKIPPLWEILPEEQDLRLSLHAGQQRAWDSVRRFIFMLAGTQSGKTSFGPLWLWREINTRGPGDYLAVTSTFPLLKRKMLPEFLKVFRDTFELGEWRESDRVFEYHDGATRVMFGSASRPESLESSTAKAAWLDEIGQDQFRLESWEAILRRLSLHQGRVLAGTTLYNLGWLKQAVYDRWRGGDSDIEVIQFDSIVNPLFPRKEYERARRSMPAWKFNLFYRGVYDRPAGLIYGDFVDDYRERGGHLVHPFDIPQEWPRYAGLDFGAVNTARILVAEDPNTKLYYVYAESLTGGKTTAEHAADLKRHLAGSSATVYGGSKSETQQRLDWQAAGVRVLEPDVADVEAGIDRLISLFKTGRLFVFDSCRGLRDELGTYSRKLDESGNPMEEIADKAAFHRLDALRYLGQGLTRPGIAYAILPPVAAGVRPPSAVFGARRPSSLFGRQSQVLFGSDGGAQALAAQALGEPSANVSPGPRGRKATADDVLAEARRVAGVFGSVSARELCDVVGWRFCDVVNLLTERGWQEVESQVFTPKAA